MDPCSITPLTLLYAQLIPEKPADADCIFNRVLSISRSRVTGYFYGMQSAYDDLAQACELPASLLASMSYGEVAYRIGTFCSETAFETDEAFAAGSSGSHRVPRVLTQQTMRAIRAFVEPLAHVALYCTNEASLIPPRDWVLPRYPSWSASTEPLSLADPLTDSTVLDDYFGQHFSALRSKCPETRLLRSFSFDACAYYQAIGRIIDQRELDDVLSSHGGERFDLTVLTRTLVKACNGQMDSVTLFLGEPLEINAQPGPDFIVEAHEALYLLFVLPYALMHISDTQPSRRLP